VLDVVAPVAIAEEAIRTEHVVVRTVLSFHNGNGSDAQGHVRQHGWPEDALGAEQRNPASLELEACGQD
jgi:hypothetical protein